MVCITIALILVGCVIGIQKTNRGREEFIASNYRKYKEDDTWKEIEEFKNYESFEDFWEHEKDDRAKRLSPLRHTSYHGEKDYYYTLYEQQSYRYWFKASFNHNASFLLPCFINAGSMLAGLMFIATIITFIVFKHKAKHKDDVKVEKKAKKKDTQAIETEAPQEGEEQGPKQRPHRYTLVTYAPTYGILA
jgi:hypothetical protein